MEFIVRRLGQGALVLVFVTTATFFLINLAPGGPNSLSNFQQTEAERAAIRRQLGLDRPVPERFVTWVGDAVSGDFGTSFSTGIPVSTMIAERLPNTILLSGAALLLAIAIGVPAGVAAAVHRDSPLDRLGLMLSAVGAAVPPFWLAILLIVLFSVMLHALPASGIENPGGAGIADRLAHLVLPATSLSMGLLPSIFQFTRASMVATLNEGYIRTAHSKGLPRRHIFMTHALKNSLIPVVSIVGTMVPRLLGGAVVTEAVFGWPGMGRLAMEAASGRDYPVIMGASVLVAVLVVIASVATDLTYLYLDPRIRTAESS